MYKKLFFVLLIMSILLIMVACNNRTYESIDLNDFLIYEGVALTGEMVELAQSDEYIALMSASETIGQVIDTIASHDYNTPKNIYLIKLPDDILLRAMNAFSVEINIPDNIMEKLIYKVNGSVIANMINASHGSEIIAATAMTTWGKSYIQPEGWSDNILLLLEYPGEFSSIVSFVQSGDGVISGLSVFVKNGDEDILTSLDAYLDMTEIEYEHYSSDRLQDLSIK